MFYNLNKDSELKRSLESACLALDRKEGTFIHAGSQVERKMSKKGTPYFTFDAGVPTKVAIFQSSNGKHGVVLELGIHGSHDNGENVQESVITIRGRVMVDKTGRPNSFFFDPYEDGVKAGRTQVMAELAAKGVIPISEVFGNRAEIEQSARAGHISKSLCKTLITKMTDLAIGA